MTSSIERDVRRKLRDDLAFYARNCLKIRTKDKGIQPLQLSATQLYLHGRIEEQKQRTGRVRMLALKGRQTYISTYTCARHYHKLTHEKGKRGFILTHEDKATANLFGMVQRFHDSCPPQVRPATGKANANELSFSGLQSGYGVGTAGNKAVGRSDTIQYFHGSEVAFWPNAEEHAAGIGQSIAKLPGTEVILESTANGIGNAFHAMWEAAEAGKSDFECCFVPWHIHEEYQAQPPKGWLPPDAFEEYGRLYKLSRERVYWAWLTNRDLAAVTGDDPGTINWKFRQEYPGNAVEAFQTSGANHFIKAEDVLRARKHGVAGVGPVVLGIDPARGGNDSFALIDRQGRKAGGHVYERFHASKNVLDNVGRIVTVVKKLRNAGVPLKRICVDCSDSSAVYDLLCEAVDPQLLTGVMFGARAIQPEHFANRRAEMWDTMRQWVSDPLGVDLPDCNILHKELTCTAWGPGLTQHRPNGQLVLEPKEKIKERLKFSPDGADALALTFAVDYSELREGKDIPIGPNLGPHAWMA